VETIIAVAAEASTLPQTLRVSGWRVRVRGLDEPLDELAVHTPDAIVLDLPYPRVASAIEQIRSGPGLEAVPLIALVEASDMKELGPHRGLSDFCVRGGVPGELSVRLTRLVKRGLQKHNPNELRCGGLFVDLKSFEASIDGAGLDLAYQEFQLLRFLVSHPAQAFSRDQLLARVWGWDYFGGARTVDIHVRRLRAKLGHPYATWLQTIRHVGYRWSPDAIDGDEPSVDEDREETAPAIERGRARERGLGRSG
jgi:DNA-binding response OmpR family regulator